MKASVLRHLPGEHPWADRIFYFDCLDSTNTLAKTMAREGVAHGTVILADRQTGGRGRLGRSFHSPGGQGIYLSVILRPGCHVSRLMHLTCAVAVAMCDALEVACGLRPGIKWTNDLVFGQKKLGGILSELSVDHNGMVEYAIVGIGINCCQREAEFPDNIRSMACSLAMVTGKEVCRCAVAAAMIDSLQRMDLSAQTGLMAQYRRDCVTLGKEISVIRGEAARRGKALDVDEEGALLVAYADGSREFVSSGEVSIRGMYGYV